MRIAQTGKISEGFCALGHAMTPVYLLDGPSPALFVAGLTALRQLYADDIHRILGDRHPKISLSPIPMETMWESEIPKTRILSGAKRGKRHSKAERPTLGKVLNLAVDSIHETESAFSKQDVTKATHALSRRDYAVGDVERGFNTLVRNCSFVAIDTKVNGKVFHHIA